jgi:hypothetical protein
MKKHKFVIILPVPGVPCTNIVLLVDLKEEKKNQYFFLYFSIGNLLLVH